MSDSFRTWKKQCEIGSGGFGTVWKVTTDTGDVLAAKYMNPTDAGTSLSQAQHEVNILKQLNHRNIVKFVTVRADNNQLVVFTELIDGNNLANLSPIREGKLQDYVRQICSALNYMHSSCNPPVLHRDIKGENIMVTREGLVKLIDFGISINLMEASGMSASQAIMTAKGCGTWMFMAPELLSARSQFSVKSDIWALGITILQMLIGHAQFSALWPTTVTAIIDRITGRGAPPLPTNLVSAQLSSFYACCTAMQAKDRKPARELLQHSFLA